MLYKCRITIDTGVCSELGYGNIGINIFVNLINHFSMFLYCVCYFGTDQLMIQPKPYKLSQLDLILFKCATFDK